MKRNYKYLTALIMTVIITVSSCQSKVNDSDYAENTSSEIEDTTTALENNGIDSVPDLNFNAYVLHVGTPDNTHYNGELFSNELNGDVFNDALYSRKQSIEERFNIKIEETVYGNGQSNVLRDLIVKETAAGECSYDFAMMTDRYALQLALQGTINNINDIPYIDKNKSYWTTQINESMEIGGKLYFLFGDISMTSLDYTHMLLFNSRLIDEYKLENPYDLVRSGKWTLDKFTEMAKIVANDTNGDGVQDPTDMYGFISTPKQILPCFWIASGIQSIKKDSSGYPYFSIPGDTRFAETFNRIFEKIRDTGIWYVTSESSNVYYEKIKMFQEGYALFAAHTLYTVGQLRDMKDDFGVLPYPKWDEKQETYYSRVEGGTQVCIVPILSERTDIAGAVIEAMASYSYNHVIPAYYETTIKHKYSRDDDSAEMFDLILANRTFDLGDTFWCEPIRDGIFAPMFANNDRTLASTMEAKRTQIEAEINKANDFFKGAK